MRRLAHLGKLLKRDQGCREGLPDDELITPVTDPKLAVFEELIACTLCQPTRYWARIRSPYLKKRLASSCGVSKTSGTPADGGLSTFDSFVVFHLLKIPDHSLYVSQTMWGRRAVFEAWAK